MANQTPATQESTSPGSMRRIAWLSAAILLLLVAATAVMMLPSGTRDPAGAAVLRAVDAFNGREFATAAAATHDPCTVELPRSKHVYTRSEMEARMAEVFDRLAYLRVRPADVRTEYEGDARATVRMEFHWTASSSMYPSARRTSERENPTAAPDVATFEMEIRDGEWRIHTVFFDIQNQR